MHCQDSSATTTPYLTTLLASTRSTKGKLVQHRQGYSSSGDQLLQVPHIHPYPLRRLVEPAMECINGYILFLHILQPFRGIRWQIQRQLPRLSMVCHNMRNHGQRLCIVLQRLLRPHANLPHDCLLACLTYTWSRANKNAKINLMGIVPIKAYYLPLGNILIKLILRGPSGLVDTIIGILSGYLYLCIQLNTLPVYNLLPDAYGKTQNNTPMPEEWVF